MPEIQVHPFNDNGRDNFDLDRTKVGRTAGTVTWLSVWFGDLEVTVFGSPEELVDFTGHLHEQALTARDVRRSEILAEFDEEDRRLEVVDNGEEPPYEWLDEVDAGVVDHRVEDMGEDPFKYEHRSDP